MVVMDFNSDVGDSWEWADSPRYPEKYSALGIRIGVNYCVVYSDEPTKLNRDGASIIAPITGFSTSERPSPPPHHRNLTIGHPYR